VIRQEPAPFWSVRFQLMPGGGIGGLTALPSLPACYQSGMEVLRVLEHSSKISLSEDRDGRDVCSIRSLPPGHGKRLCLAR
jgi:hypothetical protein